MSMNLAVCGDSYMSCDPRAPDKHFSELLSSDHQVTNLARPGVGNTDICFQIKKAIDMAVDFVIIGKTSSGRIEIPCHQGIKQDITIERFRPGPDQYYISDTIPTFIGEESDLADKYQLASEQRNAVKQYLLHIYDPDLKLLTDSWALEYWLYQLQENNIKYTVLPNKFCIYQYAEAKTIPWVFHTDFDTQQQAAELLLKEIGT